MGTHGGCDEGFEGGAGQEGELVGVVNGYDEDAEFDDV